MKPKTSQNLIKRPPVVVVVGHIDHGKSTLLDYIRKTNTTKAEAGGITQRIGAYEVEHTSSDNKKGLITFIDTPGHQAFFAMRERGAEIADIALLVVSAEDGVKPQTLEALKAIQKNKRPYIVVITKIDKPEANVEKAKQSLAENEVYVEGYGGDTPVVPVSAITGSGIPELLDMIVLLSDLEELKASESALAEGYIVEAHLDNKKGIGATLIIKNGKLETGMYVVVKDSYSPVRILEDSLGKAIKSATFSNPVRIIGWNKIPEVGEKFISFKNKNEAEEYVATQVLLKQEATKNKNIYTPAEEGIVVLPIIIKADTSGSIEGVKFELSKIVNPKVKIKIIAEGIGNINEGDVKVAQGDPNVIILGFGIKADSKAKSVLERSTIEVKYFDIIYNLIDFIKERVISKVPKEYEDEATGTAKILALFSRSKDKQIIGGKVESGSMLVGSEVKIIRRENEIGRGRIRELQEKKVKTTEVNEGHEFGTMVESKHEIAIGDRIQGFKVVEKKE